MNLHTTATVARELGISPRLVRRLAATLPAGQLHGRDWLFTDADLAAMRARNRKSGPPPNRIRA